MPILFSLPRRVSSQQILALLYKDEGGGRKCGTGDTPRNCRQQLCFLYSLYEVCPARQVGLSLASQTRIVVEGKCTFYLAPFPSSRSPYAREHLRSRGETIIFVLREMRTCVCTRVINNCCRHNGIDDGTTVKRGVITEGGRGAHGVARPETQI